MPCTAFIAGGTHVDSKDKPNLKKVLRRQESFATVAQKLVEKVILKQRQVHSLNHSSKIFFEKQKNPFLKNNLLNETCQSTDNPLLFTFKNHLH